MCKRGSSYFGTDKNGKNKTQKVGRDKREEEIKEMGKIGKLRKDTSHKTFHDSILEEWRSREVRQKRDEGNKNSFLFGMNE